MSKFHVGITGESRQQKRRRYLIFFLLLIALSILSFLYTSSKKKEQRLIHELQSKMVESDHIFNEIRDSFNYALRTGDSSSVRADFLTQALQQRNKEVEQVSGEISRLNGPGYAGKTTMENIAVLKTTMAGLKAEIVVLLARIDSLQQSRLQYHNNATVRDTMYLPTGMPFAFAHADTLALPGTASEKQAGRKLGITNVQLVADDSIGQNPVPVRRGFLSYARISLSFNATDSSTLPSSRRIFAVLVGPKANENANKEVNKIYTANLTLPYSYAKPVTVKYEWKLNEGFKAGDYKLELYEAGIKLGEASVRVKRSIRMQRYIL
ncbi:hypothetical protein [Filimonas effusa]|uniref:Uncharacterized protein n=1 Tax=Filimonas effusa TaxID=2508721 RepID=A0A4Q1D169_9BACT|nr:hypothetical protein [Filimonas effusa]RXK80831.1 hypothetical protein ESB13_21995 [Filimonas effusa]